MTSCNEYLNSVGKVEYFLVWSQGNKYTQNGFITSIIVKETSIYKTMIIFIGIQFYYINDL